MKAMFKMLHVWSLREEKWINLVNWVLFLLSTFLLGCILTLKQHIFLLLKSMRVEVSENKVSIYTCEDDKVF